jgi:hypothetical protein
MNEMIQKSDCCIVFLSEQFTEWHLISLGCSQSTS